MSTEDRIIFRQGISSGFAGLEIPKFEHTLVRSQTNKLSISSQTRQQNEPLLSVAAAPLFIPDADGAALSEIDQIIDVLQKIWNPVRQDPAVEQGAPPVNYYKTNYGICFIRNGELVWSNYLPERGVRPPGPSNEETASDEEENQFGVVVNLVKGLVQRS